MKEALELGNLKHRRVFKIEGDPLSPETPINDKRLWYTP